MLTGSSGTIVHLIEEDHDFKVFSTERKIRGKVKRKRKLVCQRREPRFSLERANPSDDCEFILISSNNKLLGILKDGELKNSEKLEKLFFFGKLDLKPKEQNGSNITSEEANTSLSSTSYDEEGNTTVSTSSPAPSSPISSVSHGQ